MNVGTDVKGRPWKRQDLTLADLETKGEVKVSLWGDRLKVPSVNAVVNITNVEVSEFRSEVSLGTTDESAVQVCYIFFTVFSKLTIPIQNNTE